MGTTKNGTAAYKAGAACTASDSTTLYAIWTANPKITYKANGGVGDDIIEYHKSGEEVTIKNTGFTKEGNSLSYWSPSENGTAEYIPGEEYTITDDLTLYAIWAKNKVTLTYNSNGGSGTIYSVTVDPETEIKLDSGTALSKTAYYITSWNTASDGKGDSYELDGTMTITADTTLYAVWTESLYIKYYSGNKCIQTQYLNGKPGIIGDAGLTPEEGYELYWTENRVSSQNRTDTPYEIGDEYSKSANLTLYAHYDDKAEGYIFTLTERWNDYNFYSIRAASTDFGNSSMPFYHRGGYVKVIEKYAFKECKNLTSYSIYMDTSVEDYAFLGCSNLRGVCFAPYVGVSSTAFMDCPNLSYFSIGKYCGGNWSEIFSHCAEKISIKCYGGIEQKKFANCSTLVTANIFGDDWEFDGKSIGDSAFMSCTALTSITIENISSISNNAFEGCTSLQEIVIYGEENSIEGYVSRWGAPEGTTITWKTIE